MRKYRSRVDKWMPLTFEKIAIYESELSVSQIWATVRLIRRYWLTKHPLADDDEILAEVSGLGAKRWAKNRKSILSLAFYRVRQGWVPHHWDEELEKALATSGVRSNAGKKGRKGATNAAPEQPTSGQQMLPPGQQKITTTQQLHTTSSDRGHTGDEAAAPKARRRGGVA